METWNTGRLYGEKGQRMAAEQIGNHVAFIDIDRGIDGCFEIPEGTAGNLRTWVMPQYDSGQYKHLCFVFGVEWVEIQRRLGAAANGDTEMRKQHSAVLESPVQQMEEQGKTDAQTVDKLDETISFAQAEREAIISLPGALTFQLLDNERVDDKGKVVPLTVTIDADTARLARALMSMQGKIVDRWRTAEETISEHPVFDAPRCYEERNSDAGKALKLFLQKANANWANAQETIAKYAGKKGLTAGEDALLGGARYQMDKANRVISNVIGVLYEHYKNRTTKTDEVNPARPGKTLDVLVDALLNTCTKRIGAKKANAKEKAQAELIKTALLWSRIDPKALLVAWKEFEAIRTAKSQQDMKAAQDSTKPKTAAEALPVLPNLNEQAAQTQ